MAQPSSERQDSAPFPVEQAVRARYSAASHAAEPALCCPVEYDDRYLALLPPELIERDYGCGDPSRYVAEGETVLDLGSGGGKICYIASLLSGYKSNSVNWLGEVGCENGCFGAVRV